mmetsp:Transcript_36852/g.60686  ORF Transcript_36852/g.60686 Transcript_36852/m.60686 type:complete len:215 (-) Transcript_36852:139-783(-)
MLGKKKTSQELSREWQREMKKEMRQTERQIRKAEANKKKMQAEMKKEAKNVNGDKQRLAAIRIMAKSVVQQEKQIAHLYGVKTQMNSVVLQIKEQQATIKMTNALKQSATVSHIMGRLVKLPELQSTMQKMSMEMQKHGLVQEMIDDQMDDVLNVDDDAVEDEIDKVVMEMTDMTLADIGSITGNLPKQQQEEKEDENDEDEMKKMQARLSSLQ